MCHDDVSMPSVMTKFVSREVYLLGLGVLQLSSQAFPVLAFGVSSGCAHCKPRRGYNVIAAEVPRMSKRRAFLFEKFEACTHSICALAEHLNVRNNITLSLNF